MDRVLGILIHPVAAPEPLIRIPSLGPFPPTVTAFQDFSTSFMQYMCENMKNKHLTPLSSSSSSEGSKALGPVDVWFVAHLQLSFARRMVSGLSRGLAEVEQQERSSEMRCARLMTLLRPSLQLARALVQVYDLLFLPFTLSIVTRGRSLVFILPQHAIYATDSFES